MTRKQIDTAEFIDYVEDHLEHLNTIPCEFESSNGVVLDAEECWHLAEVLGLTESGTNNPLTKQEV
jgi:hypothetical protein